MSAPHRHDMADTLMENESRQESLDEDLSVHIFTVSATMVGVCLTAIGLIRVVITIRGVETMIDTMVGLDAMLFVIAGLFSYWAMRSRKHGRLHHIEAIAERVFIAAMILMGISCLFLVFGIKRI